MTEKGEGESWEGHLLSLFSILDPGGNRKDHDNITSKLRSSLMPTSSPREIKPARGEEAAEMTGFLRTRPTPDDPTSSPAVPLLPLRDPECLIVILESWRGDGRWSRGDKDVEGCRRGRRGVWIRVLKEGRKGGGGRRGKGGDDGEGERETGRFWSV